MLLGEIILFHHQDLEDVRSTMQALDKVRETEIQMDMELSPVEECYAFLQQCGVAVPREEMESVDSLRYTFKNLQSKASTVQSHLVSIQTTFKTRLKDSVEVFRKDLGNFSTSYTQVHSSGWYNFEHTCAMTPCEPALLYNTV